MTKHQQQIAQRRIRRNSETREFFAEVMLPALIAVSIILFFIRCI